MNDDPELQKLYQNLDITFAMQQIADRCEELDNGYRAWLWRYIAEKKFYPLKRKTVYWWSTAFTGTSASHRVDRWLYEVPRKDLKWTTAKTIEEAYQNLVEAYLKSLFISDCIYLLPYQFLEAFHKTIIIAIGMDRFTHLLHIRKPRGIR